VHPRSLEIFESLGIIGPILDAGIKQRVVRIHSAGTLLGEIDLSSCGSRYGFNIGISEEVTEAVLTEYLHQQGGEVIRSAILVDLEEHADHLIASIQRNGTIEQASVRWVVGCDGYHSATRKLGRIEMTGHDIARPWAVFDATLSGWPESYEANYAYLDELPVILTALPDQRWRVYLQPSAAGSDIVVEATSIIKRYLSGIFFDDITNPRRFHCHSKVATHYRAGRVLLAGDGAHVCSPSQGHGMNSGLQDAFNLAWKLALVCNGHCSPTLLDSYEAERRPVAEAVVASGDESEQALGMTSLSEREARDEKLRTVFGDPTLRHHEAVAEAELDINYHSSPIVLGDTSASLSPGERLPDGIRTYLHSGEAPMLHELCNRIGHTALLIGGSSVPVEQLEQLEGAIRSHRDPFIVESTSLLTSASDHQAEHKTIVPAAAIQLGVGEITLLVIRPDGHVGLRADHNHLEALASYQAFLMSSPGVPGTTNSTSGE
jgi:2-polyprenyl-6-methoxyphenol hydroxylase-like FAD-dependent oxidoreductase